MGQYFNQEHELFRQTVRDFVQKEVAPNINKWEEDEKIPREIFLRMGELGLLGINFPEEYGGTNNDFWHTVIYLEELANNTCGGYAGSVSVHQYMATNHILLAGSEELKKKYLIPSVEGKWIGSIAISEPGAGSDVAALRCTARREGDFYIINGNKTFITNGVYGNFVTVACKTDPAAGLAGVSLIVVDQGTPGFTTNKLKKMGFKCSDTAELFFDNVKVPVSNLVGQEGQGFFYIMESFQLERLVAAILAIAGCERAIEATLKYMHERSTFGKPIEKYQALRHKMADLVTEVEITKRFIYYSCDLFAKGVFAVKECSMAKMKATELGKQVADDCLQMFGGYGYMSEYAIERGYRDARLGTIVGGTTEIMKEIISKMVIDGANYESAYNNIKQTDKNASTKEAGTKSGEANSLTTAPASAREILYTLPQRLKADKVDENVQSVFHFQLSGTTGGDFTVELKNKTVHVSDGLHGAATCVVTASANDYEDMELGRSNPQTMLMMGKIKVSNLGEIMKFAGYFKRIK